MATTGKDFGANQRRDPKDADLDRQDIGGDAGRLETEGVTPGSATQASETSPTGKGWSRSDEDADIPAGTSDSFNQPPTSAYGSGQPSSTYSASSALGADAVGGDAGEIPDNVRPFDRAGRKLADGWTNVQSEATEWAHRAQEMATDAAQRAQELGRDAVEKTTRTIRQHPTRSLLVGFGVGALVGFLFPRR